MKSLTNEELKPLIIMTMLIQNSHKLQQETELSYLSCIKLRERLRGFVKNE